MRLFFIGWSVSSPELARVVLEIKNKGHKILYWSGCDLNLVDKSKFPETIFHDHFDALANMPAPGIDASIFLPPDADIIKELYEAESIILTMMNKKYSYLSVTGRKHFYYHLIQYWRGVIWKLKPDAIVFQAIPHTVYDFVIYSLAKLFKIKTIMFEFTWISDRFFVLNDYAESNIYIKQAMRTNNQDFSLKEISLDLQEYYNKQTAPNIDTTPTYLGEYISKYSGTNKLFLKYRAVVYAVKSGQIFKEIPAYLFKQFRSNLKREYLSVQSDPDFNKKFIYVPLHFQPECSTTPVGKVFVDQILMVETLSAALPDGWFLYVKEHPAQWWPSGLNYNDFRFRNYYKHLAKISNVSIVPIKTSSCSLINKAQAVATVSGTAGWEAVLRSKPCLIFGFPWYQYCPGVFKVSDSASCKAVIDKILSGLKVEKQQVINYLAIFDRFSYHGYGIVCQKKTSAVSVEENCDNFVRVLTSEIEK